MVWLRGDGDCGEGKMREEGDSTHWESHAKQGTQDSRKCQLSPSGGTVTKAVF